MTGVQTCALPISPVGEISSAGWSPKAGACVALGYVRGDAANVLHAGTATQVGLWGENVAVKLYDRWVLKD